MAISSLTPGFRFYPSDTELVMYYLKKKLLGKKMIVDAIAELNIYDFAPWDLKDKSLLKSDLEWYFFCPKGKKYTSGSRSNRSTEIGFWKATGKDKKVNYKDRTVATRKTLVFHLGHAGKGQRTDWVMHEYKMEDQQWENSEKRQDAYVVCKIFEKEGSGPKNGAQYGVTNSAIENINAIMNLAVSVTEKENDDVIFMEYLDGLLNKENEGVEDGGIYDDLVNFVDLEELNVGADINKIFAADDLDVDLRDFYVD